MKNQFCDMQCKYARWPEASMDGAGSCRTFIAIFCDKKNKTVYKNALCKEKELKK